MLYWLPSIISPSGMRHRLESHAVSVRPVSEITTFGLRLSLERWLDEIMLPIMTFAPGFTVIWTKIFLRVVSIISIEESVECK